MSLFVTGTVALAYTAGVVGIHRYTVWRRRARCDNFRSLDWLDWDALLADVWPAGTAVAKGLTPREGGPAPRCLSVVPAGREAGHALLLRLVKGEPLEASAFEAAHFSGGEARWLAELAHLRSDPLAVLERLSAQAPVSAAEAYLTEWLSLSHAVGPFTVEWQVYACKRRLAVAMKRFGDVPALYFVRARASAQLGFTQSVLDDLGRAVFFSREAPFYVEAVLAMPFVEETRAPLAMACQAAKDRFEANAR